MGGRLESILLGAIQRARQECRGPRPVGGHGESHGDRTGLEAHFAKSKINWALVIDGTWEVREG